MAAPNSLGLDFAQLNIQDPLLSKPNEPLNDKQELPPDPPAEQKSEKKQPYVNTERVKTGGAQRDKLSEEALAERMARMKEQNEKIKQRRLDVQADEEAFRKTQESERAKLAQIRKVQENVDRTREQNAKRKMDKIQSREWDSGKPTSEWKRESKKVENATPSAVSVDGQKTDPPLPTEPKGLPPHEPSTWVRGNSRGGPQRSRGRGRGRGRGGPADHTTSTTESNSVEAVVSLPLKSTTVTTPQTVT